MRTVARWLLFSLILAIGGAAAGCGETFRDEEGGLTRQEFAACSDQVFVGHVTDVVARGESGDVDVSLEVETWLKPATGPTTVSLRAVYDPDPPIAWRVGPERRLVFVALDEPGRSQMGNDGVAQFVGGNLDELVEVTKVDVRNTMRNETTCPPVTP
ncbi:hypothetical protein KV100_04820 [Mumia sp. zg.B21]|uniref:hypothetical protein n=1 Tax=Mumia sp. zg.B21 TaxID=2855447 RepID=UPI001C6E5841|nr:hypothetical protein [Mumia sp. zg.B21]MBW9208970.1 hypothetical protein [Mumia sp. zg.B21]